ncbi:MAG: NAD(P)H-hydrate dehydratase [Chloroflexi bacterium]|nr:NAD(P)H-hydrate dehydratase [Chloroflexota bacterium]MCL5275840.1 NAD(P)H-hydrate dehydratase [Chloroflexota bacterium]
MDIVSVAQMREIERAADAGGLSYIQMMHNAGTCAAQIIRRRCAGWRVVEPGKPVRMLILAGPGNNGGDGLVCAEALHQLSAAQPDETPCTVQVYLLKPRAEDDPVFAPLRSSGIFIADAVNDLRLRVLHQMAAHADVIVDALLGTGVSRPIDGILRDILSVMRSAIESARAQSADRPDHQRPILIALDGVTGMNYDTGALDPSAVPADLTITFHAPKRGHYCYPAAGANGELVVAPIGIECMSAGGMVQDESTTANERVVLVDRSVVRPALPQRRPNANKGSYGKTLVVGGCSDYSGAPTLAASAAYRVGAGLVTLAVPRAIQPVSAVLCREATFVTLYGTADFLSPEALPLIAKVVSSLDHRHAVIIGPGMGQDRSTRAFLVSLLDLLRQKEGGARLVVDADALNHLATLPEWRSLLPPGSILTPHPGEMARLTGSSVADIQADRIGNALRYARRWGHTVVLKGAHTVAAHPQNGGAVLPYANPALAVAGTGDVLAGCIGGMLAQGLEPFQAACCGASLHAMAGEQWRQQHGSSGLLAGDLLALLPDALHSLAL